MFDLKPTDPIDPNHQHSRERDLPRCIMSTSGRKCRRFDQKRQHQRLADVCHRKTETIDPHDDPQSFFAYVDISSIDPTSKSISAPKLVRGKDASKRARRLVRSGDVLVSTVRPKLNAVALAVCLTITDVFSFAALYA